uniref:Uncharacterized protein n=1 Tax=Brassica oleracea var. oleracea TaxID=109376 RepID=A0A0D3ABI3_BRAOL
MASQKIQKVHPPFHFVLFPFMAQGYMIPMVDIARLLVQHGVTITIVTTPHKVERFNNVLNRAIEAGFILPSYTRSEDQLDDMFTKSARLDSLIFLGHSPLIMESPLIFPL